MHSILQDLRYGMRTMRKSPGFTAIALATLAVGIGATTLMFAMVSAVLIRSLDYPQADQVVHLSEAFERRPGMSIAYANFLDWQRMNHVFSSMGAVRARSLTLSGSAYAQQLEGREVSSGFLATLGVKPFLGHDFSPADDVPSAAPAIILGYKVWQQKFDGNPGLIGKTITVDRRQYAVIGVLPRHFSYNDVQPDFLVPIGLTTDFQFWQNRYAHAGTYSIARMKPGVSLSQARDDMDRIAETLQREYPATNKSNWASVVSMQEYMVGDVRMPLLILLAAVGLLLLIACGNVANLLLAKGTSRSRELAIRLALGAPRARIVRQLLTESVALSLVGALGGALLAVWGTGALRTIAADSLPRITEVQVDGMVLAVAFVTALLTGVLCGIAPALISPPAGAQGPLKEGERGLLSRSQQRTRSALIAGELALSLALLLSSGLLIRSFQRVMQVDAGFDPHRLLTGFIILSPDNYKSVAEAEAFANQALRNIRAIPGVAAASSITPMPMSGNEHDTDYLLEGMRLEDQKQVPNTEIGLFGPGYPETMKIPILAGRAFTEADNEHSLPVAIVNQEFVRKNWPNQSPIGKKIRLGDPQQLAGPETRDSRWLTVVGVIGNVKQYGLDQRTVPTVYRPYAQTGAPFLRRDLVIRTSAANPLSIVNALRDAVAKADREQAIADLHTMDEQLASRLSTRTLSTYLLAFFAAVALALGSVGIYGVVSYWVVQRTQEIGIRLALGASRNHILQLILGRAFILLAIGVGAGLGIALALARSLQSMLYGIGPADPLVLALVIAVLSVAVSLAGFVPARRATKVDPMVALRYE